MWSLLVVAVLAAQSPAAAQEPPATIVTPVAVIADDLPVAPPPPTPAIVDDVAARAAQTAEEANEAKDAVRQQSVDATIVGVAVASGISYVVLMGAGTVTALALSNIFPALGYLGLAMPIVGVPLTVVLTAAFLAPEGEMLSAVAGAVTGHYGGLIGGTLGGILVGAVGGVALAIPTLVSDDGSGGGLATAVALMIPFVTAGLGGLVGAGVGGMVGSGIGARVALDWE